MKTLVTFLLSLTILIAISATSQASPERWLHEGWKKTDFSTKSIDYSEIMSGGPPKDGIPSIDEPKFATVKSVTDLADTEPVIGLSINGKAKAYPLRILIWHEIVNDELAGVPVTVTYCPLCNSAIVFDRRVNGQVLDFGTTGKLRNSDLVMYDRQTESWWQQFIGTGIAGEMTGTELKSIPARLEAFALFKKRYPEGLVLVPANPKFRDYGRNPYFNYDSAAKPFLFRGDMPEGISPMARVIMFKRGGKPQAVAMELIAEKKSVKFDDIQITWTAGQNSALDDTQIEKGRDVGNITVQKITANGTEDIVYDVTFAFVANAFHPGITFQK
jgi:hypothetical protein